MIPPATVVPFKRRAKKCKYDSRKRVVLYGEPTWHKTKGGVRRFISKIMV